MGNTTRPLRVIQWATGAIGKFNIVTCSRNPAFGCPMREEAPVRINISINKRLLRDVDVAAKREGMTRSGLLAAAARSMLAQLRG